MFDGIHPWHVLVITLAVPCTLAAVVVAALWVCQWLQDASDRD